MYREVESVCYTPEANITLCAKYTQIKKKQQPHNSMVIWFVLPHSAAILFIAAPKYGPKR